MFKKEDYAAEVVYVGLKITSVKVTHIESDTVQVYRHYPSGKIESEKYPEAIVPLEIQEVIKETVEKC